MIRRRDYRGDRRALEYAGQRFAERDGVERDADGPVQGKRLGAVRQAHLPRRGQPVERFAQRDIPDVKGDDAIERRLPTGGDREGAGGGDARRCAARRRRGSEPEDAERKQERAERRP
jgi:hypothetical protein